MARARTKNVRGQGERLRRELLDAANAALDEHGDPAAVTVRGVAAAVGVAPNAVYLHFADRESLLAAIVVDRFEDFAERIRAARDAAGDDPLDRLRAGTRAYLQFAREHPGHYRLLLGQGELEPDNPELRQRIHEVALAAFDLCVESCRQCVEAGLHDGDPEHLAYAMWTMEHGYADLAGTCKGQILPDPDVLVDALFPAARTSRSTPARSSAATAGQAPVPPSRRRARASSSSA